MWYGKFIGEAGYGIFFNGNMIATTQNRTRCATLVLKLQKG